MRTFKDCEGRTWSVTLNVHQMKRIRANLGVDLVNVIALDAGGKVKVDLVDRIANDPCSLWTSSGCASRRRRRRRA